ncbi:hypothetical protein [Roseibium album]|uniref:hypothetical protein n=1 Tax=Roseibium album TaxID=311410 RepID=UPI002490EE86|nr:hypothetical protein [Roseibium album]
MEDDDRVFFGVVQRRPKLSEDYQRQELIKFGCEPQRIVGIKDFEPLLKRLDPERDHAVLVYRVDILAGKKAKGEQLPRAILRRRVNALRKTKCPVIEVSTNRHCGEGDNLLDMVLDAYDRLAGNKSATEKIGRPQKEKTPAEIDHARLVWTSTQYSTNEEAYAALEKMGWTRHLMNKYKLGGSGRKAGKPKQK